MNDTAGPNGLVPTLLVFGVLPRVPIIPSKLPDQLDRLKLMRSAKKEMAQVIAKSKLTKALRMNIPSSCNRSIKIGDDVLVYREPPVKKWIGPFKVVNVDDKMAHLDYNGELKLYSIDKLKVYNEDLTTLPPASSTSSEQSPPPDDHSLDLLGEFRSIISRTETGTAPSSSLANNIIQGLTGEQTVHLASTIESSDPIAKSP